MAGIQHCVIGDFRQDVGEAVVELLWVSAGKIRSAAPLQEQRVSGDQPVLDEEALRPRCVPWGVQQINGDLAHL